jgi:hypothetical protein
MSEPSLAITWPHMANLTPSLTSPPLHLPPHHQFFAMWPVTCQLCTDKINEPQLTYFWKNFSWAWMRRLGEDLCQPERRESERRAKVRVWDGDGTREQLRKGLAECFEGEALRVRVGDWECNCRVSVGGCGCGLRQLTRCCGALPVASTHIQPPHASRSTVRWCLSRLPLRVFNCESHYLGSTFLVKGCRVWWTKLSDVDQILFLKMSCCFHLKCVGLDICWAWKGGSFDSFPSCTEMTLCLCISN